MARIGVLALQGGVLPHLQALQRLGHHPVPVRGPADLPDLAGLVLPGGESGVHLRLIDRYALAAPLEALVRRGVPVLATCAGLILAARQVTGPAQRSFGWLDVAVQRNGWGRQLDSFEARSDDGQWPLVFIRAPRIVHVGAQAQVLATVGGEPVLVRQGPVTGAAFHPELANDDRLHREVFGPAQPERDQARP